MRRLELEWLYRLIVQPWRWKRQLELPKFAALVLLDAGRQALHTPCVSIDIDILLFSLKDIVSSLVIPV